MQFVKPTIPAVTKHDEIKFRDPFQMPAAGKDEIYTYVCGIKHDAVFDAYNIGYVDFAKRTMPTAASLTENHGKHFEPRIPTKLLTEKQFYAVQNEAKRRTVTKPSTPNLDYDPIKAPDEPEYYPEKTVVVDDWLIFCKAEDYKPDQAHMDYLREIEQAAQPQDLQQDVNKEIYDAQRGKSSNKKGK
jgi:hypothetical protein